MDFLWVEFIRLLFLSARWMCKQNQKARGAHICCTQCRHRPSNSESSRYFYISWEIIHRQNEILVVSTKKHWAVLSCRIGYTTACVEGLSMTWIHTTMAGLRHSTKPRKNSGGDENFTIQFCRVQYGFLPWSRVTADLRCGIASPGWSELLRRKKRTGPQWVGSRPTSPRQPRRSQSSPTSHSD